MRRQNLCDDSLEADPLLLQGARGAVITTVAVISKVVLLGFNNTRLIKDDRYARLVELVRNRQVDVFECVYIKLYTTARSGLSILCHSVLIALVLPRWDER